MSDDNVSTSTVEVHDAGDLRKYRTEIPNVVLEMGLSPHALALYIHLKRTAGQSGKCWKATKRLAEEAGMSAGKVSEARAELEVAKLIVVERPSRRKTAIVTITDVWLKNFNHFASVQNMNTERSEYETRKEPLEESSFKEQDEPAKSWENAKTGEKQAALIAYLHQRHTERDLKPPTSRQKERLSGELRTHINRGVAKADLYFALDKIVEAKRRGQALELYQALSDDNVRHLRAVDEKPSRPGGGLESLSERMARLGIAD